MRVTVLLCSLVKVVFLAVVYARVPLLRVINEARGVQARSATEADGDLRVVFAHRQHIGETLRSICHRPRCRLRTGKWKEISSRCTRYHNQKFIMDDAHAVVGRFHTTGRWAADRR